MKPLKVVMLEFVDECDHWSWYDVIRDTTPRKAIKQFMEECHPEEKYTIEKDAYTGYLMDNTEFCRAYYITI